MSEDTVNPFSRLTPAQNQVAVELVRGFSNQEIANVLGLKLSYVNKVVSAIYCVACLGKGTRDKRNKLIMMLQAYDTKAN